jgi:hypothetical protein
MVLWTTLMLPPIWLRKAPNQQVCSPETHRLPPMVLSS